jgi:hypothetical protein
MNESFPCSIRVNFDSLEGPLRTKPGSFGLHLIGFRVRSLACGQPKEEGTQPNRQGYIRMESYSQALMWWTAWHMGPKENVKI